MPDPYRHAADAYARGSRTAPHQRVLEAEMLAQVLIAGLALQGAVIATGIVGIP